MALSLDQTLTLYETLKVPYSDSVTIPDDPYYMSSHEYQSANPSQKMQVRITARLLEIEANVELENRLGGLLNKIALISVNTATISGAVGSIQGVDYNPTIALERLASRVKVIIPVIDFHEEITNAAIYNNRSVDAIR